MKKSPLMQVSKLLATFGICAFREHGADPFALLTILCRYIPARVIQSTRRSEAHHLNRLPADETSSPRL